MNIEEIRNYFLSKKEASECLPFGDETLVFKVLDKMFGLLNLEGDLSINLKCDPDKAIDLREHYPAITPGYHMNKKYWNSVCIDGSLTFEQVCQMIDHSYDEVVKKMTGKQREILENWRE